MYCVTTAMQCNLLQRLGPRIMDCMGEKMPATNEKSNGPCRRHKVVKTINFEPDVLAYLAELQQEFDRDRSYLVNALVKQFRHRRERQEGDSTAEAISKPLQF